MKKQSDNPLFRMRRNHNHWLRLEVREILADLTFDQMIDLWNFNDNYNSMDCWEDREEIDSAEVVEMFENKWIDDQMYAEDLVELIEDCKKAGGF